MRHTLGCLLLLLPCLPALGGQDKPLTPKEKQQALLKRLTDANKAMQVALSAAKTGAEHKKAFNEYGSELTQLAEEFLELAEKNPKTPIAFDATVWILTNMNGGAKREPRAKAAEILLRDHVQNEKLGSLCQNLGGGYDGVDLLRGIAEHNSNQEVQAEAVLALGRRLSYVASLTHRLKEQPEIAKGIEQLFGKEQLEEFQKLDIAKTEAQSAQYFKVFGEKYATQMKPDRLTQLCETLRFEHGIGGEAVPRALLEKDQRREVQGMACLALARTLKHHADVTPEAEATHAAELRKQSEKYFDLAILKYADLEMPYRVTIGEQAKRELFELQHLTIGVEALDIEGEDAEGEHFKLSDYRGKVVLLVFWGNWCVSCRTMYPHQRSLVETMQQKPFVILGVNSDPRKEDLKKVLTKENITWRSWWDGGTMGPIASKWNTWAPMTMFVIDHTGKIRHRWFGSPGDSVLDQAIEKLVKAAQGGAAGQNR